MWWCRRKRRGEYDIKNYSRGGEGGGCAEEDYDEN